MENKELFSLGKLYPSDFLKTDEQPRCEPVELKLVMDDDGIVKLSESAPKEAMWGDRYWYQSGINSSMKESLKDVVDSILPLKMNCDFWLDIACNDGTLLSHVPKNLCRIGVDPCGGEIHENAKKHGTIIKDYFKKEQFYYHESFDVITAISMFYDLDDPGKFLDDVKFCLDKNGIFVLQLSYSPLMLNQLEFGNICHEHRAYYSLFNLRELLIKHGFQIMDVTLNNTNAGSFRLFIMKEDADITKFGSQTHRDVCSFRVWSLMHYENLLQLDVSDTWVDFYDSVNALKKQTLDFIISEKQKGKTIMGYGASTKFNTVLQYFGLTTEHLTAIADRSPAKHGLRTVGSNIPIISEDEMRAAKPDYLLVGPAHFISEFKEREKDLLKSDTKFIILMPKFEII